jgi:hypothetical protein
MSADTIEFIYDDPTFNRGVTHVVDLLAKTLGVTDWVSGDGSEDYDEDLAQTLMNILTAKGLYNPEDGVWAARPHLGVERAGWKYVYVKRWRTLIHVPKSIAAEIRDALAGGERTGLPGRGEMLELVERLRCNRGPVDIPDILEEAANAILALLPAAQERRVTEGKAVDAAVASARETVKKLRYMASPDQSGSYLPAHHVFRDAADTMETLIAASLSASPPAPASEGWREIGSAPKDQSAEIWVYDAHSGISYQAVWKDRHAHYASGGWYTKPFTGDSDRLARPTHWQPLPAPPSIVAEPKG